MTKRAQMRFARVQKLTDEGSVSLVVLFMISVLMFVAAIVFDDGLALSDRQRATSVAEQAARAGADAVVPGDGATVDPRLDPARAELAAESYLNGAGVEGTVSATQTEVSVVVTINHQTKLLSAFGVTTLTVHGSATARPIPGLLTQAGG